MLFSVELFAQQNTITDQQILPQQQNPVPDDSSQQQQISAQNNSQQTTQPLIENTNQPAQPINPNQKTSATTKVRFISDEPGVIIQRLVLEGYGFGYGSGGPISMGTYITATTPDGGCMTPCELDLPNGQLFKYVVGEGAGSRQITINTTGDLQTWQVERNRPWATYLGILSTTLGLTVLFTSIIFTPFIESEDDWYVIGPSMGIGAAMIILGIWSWVAGYGDAELISN